MTGIPEHELALLLLNIQEAVEMATAREDLHGYHCLVAGLERAREYAREGEPWAPQLEQRYLDALEEFTERWGLEALSVER
jgi:hypothetical protein